MATTWVSASLTELFPEVFEPLVAALEDSAEAITDALVFVRDAVVVFEDLIPFPISSVAGLSFEQLLADIQALLFDLVNAGIFLLLVEPDIGGSTVFSGKVTRSLFNEDDPNRPQISDNGFMGAVTIVGAAPTLAGVQDVIQSISTAFLGAPRLSQAQIGLDAIPSPTPIFEPHFTNRFTGEDVRERWMSATVLQAIPEAEELMQRLQDMVAGFQDLIQQNPLSRYVAFLESRINQILASISQLRDILDGMAAAFDSTPVTVMLIDPEVGGTNQFDINFTQAFAPTVPGAPQLNLDTFVGGIILAVGGPSLSPVQSSYDTMLDVYGL